LVIEEVLHLAGNLISTGFVPSKVVLGISKLLLETLSVLLGLCLKFLVHFHDFGELGDGEETNLLVGGVLNVSSGLGINVLLFKVLKEIKDGIDGITGLCSGLEEGHDLVLGTCGGGKCCCCKKEHNKG
jgi:hypothetical protein